MRVALPGGRELANGSQVQTELETCSATERVYGHRGVAVSWQARPKLDKLHSERLQLIVGRLSLKQLRC